VIRRIDAVTGSISVIAGNGTEGLKGDGGQASNAQLVYPLGFAIDLDGNLYVADSNNFVVRKISAATGIITTIAGNGLQGWANDGVPATAESLMFPGSLAFDTTHNLFIGEAYLGIIHRVDTATGLIYRVAGNGDRGYTGDGGLATNASFNWPAGIAIDGAGNLFIADSKNNVIREVFASTGIVQTVAGTGVAGSSGDGGPAIEAQLNDPAKIGVDFNGNLYIADTSTNTIRRVDSLSHTITTFAGQGAFSGYAANGKPAKDVSLSMDYDGTITIDPNGNLWVRDYNTGLMKINTQTGIVTTPIDVSLLKETPSYAVNIAVDAVGNVFLSENENMRVRAALVSSLQITVNAEVPTPPAVSVTKAAVTTVPSGPNKTANVVVVQFSGLLNPKDAIKTSIYGLRSLATAKAKAKTIAVSKAVYDAATQTVKLYTGAKLKAGDAYVLTIQQGNLHDTFNRPLNLKKSGIFQLKFS
jgi:sugar lactone lactonase YvrE